MDLKNSMALYGKEPYKAPTATIVEVEMEATVAASGGPFDPFNNDGGTEKFLW